METPRTYRQGDVLLIETHLSRMQKLRAMMRPVPRDEGRIVLAYGEVTGHAHAIEAPEKVATLTEAENARFLLLVKDVDLVHEEHDTVTLPAGDYKVVQQETFIAPERPAARVWD